MYRLIWVCCVPSHLWYVLPKAATISHMRRKFFVICGAKGCNFQTWEENYLWYVLPKQKISHVARNLFVMCCQRLQISHTWRKLFVICIAKGCKYLTCEENYLQYHVAKGCKHHIWEERYLWYVLPKATDITYRKKTIRDMCCQRRQTVFKSGISVLGPKGPYPPKRWGQLINTGDSSVFDSWKPRFIWLLSCSLVFGLSRSLSAAAAGGCGSDWSLIHWEGPSSLNSVEDSVVSPFDLLGKKLSTDRSFLLHSAMITYQQYCASDHVLSIHETRTLIGPPYPISWYDIICSCYPENFCRHKYK